MTGSASPERELSRLELPVRGMDCANCVRSVQQALAELPGVVSAEVFLSAEKAMVQFDPLTVTQRDLRKAVEGAGYVVPEPVKTEPGSAEIESTESFTRSAVTLLGVVFGVVLFVVVVGEGLGLFKVVTAYVPRWIGIGIVAVFGYPIFRNVVRSALKRQVTSHTLMSVGALAALAIGEWTTAAIVVFFMRVGNYTEHFTAERARRSLKDLTALAPQTARVLQGGLEQTRPISQVQLGDIIVVRPGEKIPVDGEVTGGQATVNQATITGEARPVEVGEGSSVFAATHAQLGSLRIRTTGIGQDTIFGKVITQVEEAEANRGETQQLADKFSAYYLPVVASTALLTYLLSRDLLATVAVMVVACSCAFALATPVAMLASIGAAARRGLLIKGGKYIEALAAADTLLIDKTGTLTQGDFRLTDVIPLGRLAGAEVLELAASAERDSEHPLAALVRRAAAAQNLSPTAPEHFEAVPGQGVKATVRGRQVVVGNQRLVDSPLPGEAATLSEQGKTLVFVTVDGELAGILAASDTLRPEVPEALARVRALGIKKIEILTGDNEHAAALLAASLGVAYQANLLPEDKIAVVKKYQAEGHKVVMVGDGVNDAPALVQADVGIAVGVTGSDVAIDAAHIALMRDDWLLIPEALHVAKRTMGVVKLNIGFTAVYNLVGISLAAFGLLPPIFAAALQSVPDLGMMANSARLLRVNYDLEPGSPPHKRKVKAHSAPRSVIRRSVTRALSRAGAPEPSGRKR